MGDRGATDQWATSLLWQFGISPQLQPVITNKLSSRQKTGKLFRSSEAVKSWGACLTALEIRGTFAPCPRIAAKPGRVRSQPTWPGQAPLPPASHFLTDRC